MATIDELRDRSAGLFTGRTAAARGRTADQGRFSWFDAADGPAAVRLAARLSVLAAAAPTVEEGLERALDVAEARIDDDPTALVQQAMALFVTHDRAGRLLGRPRTLRARPELFGSFRDDGGAARESTPGLEPVLDYWREDLFANEHHDHWHQVYPWPGMAQFARGFLAWAGSADRAGLAAVFETLDPGQDWPAFLAAAGPEEVAATLLPLMQAAADTDWNAFIDALPPQGYRTVFRLNDRQGELFLYMHTQMLARYDAERLSNARGRVEAFGPDFTATITDGYLPDLPPFTDRGPDEKLAQADVDALEAMQAPLDAAIAAQQLQRAVGSPKAVDGDTLGDAVEASLGVLTGLSDADYPGMHNRGHGMFGRIPNGQGFGVMNVPAVAIRDPVFWRWHKHIDNISIAWQETQPPYDFSDTPRVLVRDALAGVAQADWASPDVLLVSTAGLAAGADPAALVTAAAGGAAFDTAVPAGPLAGAAGLAVVDELTTRMTQSTLDDGRTVTYLTHDPFALVVRLRNLENRPSPVTLRTFLVPDQLVHDRTAWMELDKFLVEVPAGGRSVVYRPDTEFAVVKKPAETDPQTVLDGENDPNDPNYCDCGWPYTLLLPRGTEAGMRFRLAVFCTDGGRDLVGPTPECGSMSFCGAVDRYPDTRDMGYPFSRPLAATIQDTIRNLPAAAGRTLTIRHVVQLRRPQ